MTPSLETHHLSVFAELLRNSQHLLQPDRKVFKISSQKQYKANKFIDWRFSIVKHDAAW